MPSPIGHSLCGYAIFSALKEKGEKINWKELLGFILIANVADIDYLAGFLIGKPNEFHHQITHSFVFALVAAAGIACFYKNRKFFKYFIIIFLLYSSHIIVDYFARDTSLPYGEQLFWPFSSNYFISSVSIFRDVQKADNLMAFFPALFSLHNFYTVLIEIIVFVPIIIFIQLTKKVQKIKNRKQN